MTATLMLPRMLAEAVDTDQAHVVEGSTVVEVLRALFDRVPGVRGHLVDESGAIRPHVSVFVDGVQATLETGIDDGAEVRVLQAVSGG